jgi:HK97 gp10 family phage protein
MAVALMQPDLRRLAEGLAALGPVAHAATRAIIRVGGEAAYTNAKATAAVRTGYMRSTVYVKYDSDGLGFELGALAPYSGFVEYGTSHMPPQPFLVPAFDQAVQISEFAINTMLTRLL